MIIRNDALPLEAELVKGCPLRDYNITDIVNDPAGLGVVWISGLSLQEHFLDFFRINSGTMRDDRPDLLVVGVDAR